MNDPARKNLPPPIRRVLSGLRWTIRAYVWVEGLSVAVIWLCLTFWTGLALDYLPVLVGADEMPRLARAILLVAIAAVLAAILYRWILRRTFARLADHSLALLIERRHRDFHDGLITTVELARGSSGGDFNPQMFAHTQETALEGLHRFRLASVFNMRPLLLALAGALLLVSTVGGAYAAERLTRAELLELGFRRLYLLDDRPFPRQAAIEVVGVRLKSENDGESVAAVPKLITFDNRQLKVARGASLALTVRALGSAKRVPTTCTIHYRTAEGDRGRVNMTRIGIIRDGYQEYRYEGKPLKGLLSDLQFDVVGFDHRLRDYHIQVVDSPVVIDAQLACEFPQYMVDEELSSWLPRTVPLTTATQLPRGTHITLQAQANKPLREVLLRNPETKETVSLQPDGDRFLYDVQSLGENLSLEATLVDTDNVVSERPYHIYIVGLEDQPPLVRVRLQGIGTAVTPDVLLPVRGTIEDDYAVAESWFDVAVNDGAARKVNFPLGPAGAVESHIDFREHRSNDDGIKLQPDDKLGLTIQATDRYDLGTAPNVGLGDHYQLDVVTPDRLLSMLEARELGLRKRFEQINDEMQELRDMLLRVKSEGPQNASSEAEASASPEPATASAAAEQATENTAQSPIDRAWSLRMLRAQRAQLQSEKSSQETLGVAASFSDIREELVNNRVDSEDRKQRIQDQIVTPLQSIGDVQFPELDRRLVALVARLDELTRQDAAGPQEDGATVTLAEAAVSQTNDILLAMEQVLQNMLDIEDYNELLDRVRDLIAEQEGLLDETKTLQKRQILELIP